ncbi:DUF2325 domain-containing protein [Calidifontibacillus erzurumensis]|uniref:DUF2325 domain-containing protein n=1 Tax=Calidifontibacillus erzurumensis TaxID=2741433 RepID=UPI0035B504A2
MILSPIFFDFSKLIIREKRLQYKVQKTVAIIGGSQHNTMKQIAKKAGLLVLFDDGKSPNEAKYRKMVNQSDSIIIMTGACSHPAMWLIKSIAKEESKPIIFHRGRGVSGAIQAAVNAMTENKSILV